MTEPSISTLTRTIDGVTLSLRVLEQLSSMGETVLDELAARRSEWSDGFYIWLGWSPFMLRTSESGFDVIGPDLTSDPRQNLTDDLSLALWINVQLLDVAQRAGVEPQDIQFNSDVICTLDWESSPGLQLSRTQVSNPADSGWFIQPFPAPPREEEWDPEELVRLEVWQILQARQNAVPVLALPIGVTAVTDDEGLRIVFRDSDAAVLYDRNDEPSGGAEG